MLNLFLSEIKYNKIIYAIYLVMLPIFYTVVLHYENNFMQGMIMALFPFLLINQLIAQRNKEARERMFNTLPVNRELLGIHRLLLVLLPILLCFTVLYIIGAFIANSNEELEKVAILYGLITIALSVYFIIRDLFLSYLREKGVTKNKMLIYFMVAGLFFNVAGIVVFMLAKAGYNIPIKSVFEFIEQNNPFSGELVEIRTIAFGLMISVLSIYSYNRNRSYLE